MIKVKYRTKLIWVTDITIEADFFKVKYWFKLNKVKKSIWLKNVNV